MASTPSKVLTGLALITVLAIAALLALTTGQSPAVPPLPNPNGYEDFVRASEAVNGNVGDFPTLDQGSGSVISYAWLQQYGLPTSGSADYADADYDGMNNSQEWICGTCPTNPLSVLHMMSATPQGTNLMVTWQGVAGVNYFLERSESLASPFTPVAMNIVGQAVTTSYADTNAASAGPFFYRAGLKCP